MFRLEGVEYRRCPLSVLPDDVWEFLAYFPYYRQGLLPEAGGVGDQSGSFLQAAGIIEAEIARMLKERAGGDE